MVLPANQRFPFQSIHSVHILPLCGLTEDTSIHALKADDQW